MDVIALSSEILVRIVLSLSHLFISIFTLSNSGGDRTEPHYFFISLASSLLYIIGLQLDSEPDWPEDDDHEHHVVVHVFWVECNCSLSICYLSFTSFWTNLQWASYTSSWGRCDRDSAVWPRCHHPKLSSYWRTWLRYAHDASTTKSWRHQ